MSRYLTSLAAPWPWPGVGEFEDPATVKTSTSKKDKKILTDNVAANTVNESRVMQN